MTYCAQAAVLFETEPPEIVRDGDNFLVVSRSGPVEIKRVLSRRVATAYVNRLLAAISEADAEAVVHPMRCRRR